MTNRGRYLSKFVFCSFSNCKLQASRGVTAAGGGAASQLVKFKGCVQQSICQGALISLLLLRSWESAAAVIGPPTSRPVRGAARLVGEPFLLCVIGRSTSDVLGGPRKPTDGRAGSFTGGGPRVYPHQATGHFSPNILSLPSCVTNLVKQLLD